MSQVIRLFGEGQANVMALLFANELTMEGVMYIVKNATSYANAISIIAKHEKLTDRQVDDIIYRQNGKKFKYKFLKSLGYKNMSKLNMQELNEKLAFHFDLTEGDL